MPAPTVFATAQATNNSATTITVTVPAGVTAAHTLLLVFSNASSVVPTFPEGFLTSGEGATFSGHGSHIARRQAAAGDAGTTLTVTSTSTGHKALGLVVLADARTPNSYDGATFAIRTTGSVNYVTPALASIAADCIELAIACDSQAAGASTQLWTVPAGFTKALQVTFPPGTTAGGNSSLVVAKADATSPAGSAGGTRTLTSDDGALGSMWTVWIAPAAVAGNNPPTVAAGADQTVEPYAPFSLTATASDPDGGTPTITWAQLSGEIATLTGTGATRSCASAPPSGSPDVQPLVFEATATDAGGATATDTVTISVLPPTEVYLRAGGPVPCQTLAL